MTHLRIAIVALLLGLSIVLMGCPADGQLQPSPTPADVTPLPPAQTPEIDDEEELLEIGEASYSAQCAVCHQQNGQGITGTYPALAGNDFVVQEDPQPVIDVVLNGRGGMPNFRRLPDHELAGIVSYVRNSWGNDASIVTQEQIRLQR
jgi:mono/diheme cytochrome c family protein